MLDDMSHLHRRKMEVMIRVLITEPCGT